MPVQAQPDGRLFAVEVSHWLLPVCRLGYVQQHLVQTPYRTFLTAMYTRLRNFDVQGQVDKHRAPLAPFQNFL